MIVLDSEWSDECIDFTIMCIFFLCVRHHRLGQSNCFNFLQQYLVQFESEYFEAFRRSKLKISNSVHKHREKQEFLRKIGFW